MVSSPQLIRYSLDMQIVPFLNRIGFDDKVCLLGSCFTEHIGKRLSNLYFETFINPNGIVFNPISLAEPVKRLGGLGKYTHEDLILYNNKWAGLYHHGCFSSDTEQDCLDGINKSQLGFEAFITSAKFLIVTFGTAWVYEHIETGNIVANCHKIPQNQFKKRLLEVDEIVKSWEEAISILNENNKALTIIFTVSPVKHLRDGVNENNLSKATLLLAIEKLKRKGIQYFPAYELVIDDLRDYRFFEHDAAHPTSLAIDYVFDKFRQSVLSDPCNEMIEGVVKYLKLKNHRPISSSDLNEELRSVQLKEMRERLTKMSQRILRLD